LTTNVAPEPRYGRFRITYPSGTVFDSYFLVGGGGTVRPVQVEHPLAKVDPVLDSRVATPGED
jgi:hypothetical protein